MLPLLNLKLNVRDATDRSRANKPLYSTDVGAGELRKHARTRGVSPAAEVPPADTLPPAETDDPFSWLSDDVLRLIQGSIDDCRQLARSCRISKAFASRCEDPRFWPLVLDLKGWRLTWDLAADPRNVFRMLCELDDNQRELLLNLDGVSTVPEDAFEDADLSSLTALPPTLTAIATGAFQRANLSSLTALPPTLTTIGSFAFYGADLSSLRALPPTLTTVGVAAFEGANLPLVAQ